MKTHTEQNYMSILKKSLVGLVAAATVSVAFAAGHGNAPEAGTV